MRFDRSGRAWAKTHQIAIAFRAALIAWKFGELFAAEGPVGTAAVTEQLGSARTAGLGIHQLSATLLPTCCIVELVGKLGKPLAGSLAS